MSKVVQHIETGSFEQLAYAAHLEISPSTNTRRAYWDDVRAWMKFCRLRGIDPFKPQTLHVTLWVEEMKERGCAPKTRARRVVAMASVYRYLRRLRDEDGNPAPAVKFNPFSVDDGPKREKAQAKRPTPMASPEVILKLLKACEGTHPLEIRDRALIRILWATGARRASVIEMTHERLKRLAGGSYEAPLVAKGSKEVRVLIKGKAAVALAEWLDVLDKSGIDKGPIWRTKRGTLTPKGLWAMIRARAKRAQIKERIAPHMFRVAFLTINPAGLEAKQSAAGHTNPATTMLYDRASWRGREAFERMPELEDAKTDD